MISFQEAPLNEQLRERRGGVKGDLRTSLGFRLLNRRKAASNPPPRDFVNKKTKGPTSILYSGSEFPTGSGATCWMFVRVLVIVTVTHARLATHTRPCTTMCTNTRPEACVLALGSAHTLRTPCSASGAAAPGIPGNLPTDAARGCSSTRPDSSPLTSEENHQRNEMKKTSRGIKKRTKSSDIFKAFP